MSIAQNKANYNNLLSRIEVGILVLHIQAIGTMASDIVLKAAQEFASSVKIAKSSDRVYKSECMFCFKSPLSPAGLFINLKSYQCFCERHLGLDQRRSGCGLYLRVEQTKVKYFPMAF